MMRFLRTLMVIGCWLAGQAMAFEGFVASDIRVDGLQRISACTVFNYLPVKAGDRIGSEQTAEIIGALFNTGFFKDVTLQREDNVLVIQVVERPAITEIKVSGNKEMETEDQLR